MAGRLDDEEIEQLFTILKVEVAQMMAAWHDAYAKTWEEWASEFQYVGSDDSAGQIYSEAELDDAMPGGWHVDDGLPEGWQVIEGGAPPRPRRRRRRDGRPKR